MQSRLRRERRGLWLLRDWGGEGQAFLKGTERKNNKSKCTLLGKPNL